MTENAFLPFLPGWTVDLRPPCKETDLETCLAGMNDPEVRQYLIGTFPLPRQAEEEWFDRKPSNPPTDIMFAVQTKRGEFLGNIGLHRVSWTDGTAATGTALFRKDHWGRKAGTEAKMLLLNYAFNTLRLRRICTQVYGFNERSLRCQLRCGYKEEGRQKEHIWRQRYLAGRWDEGAFYDLVLLAVFREDWLPRWREYQASRTAAL